LLNLFSPRWGEKWAWREAKRVFFKSLTHVKRIKLLFDEHFFPLSLCS
jgi:hypothetical protein